MDYYFNNKKHNHGHHHGGHGHHGCTCGCCSYCLGYYKESLYHEEYDFSKYTEVSKFKCEEATEVSEEAKRIAILAKEKEYEVMQHQKCASQAACEAVALWEEYHRLTSESSKLLKEAQKAIEEINKSTKKHHIHSYHSLKKICGCGFGCNCGCGC